MRKAKTTEQAFSMTQDGSLKGEPHGWIQWKDTNVCMDVICKCGELAHVDEWFCYNVKCPTCGAMYMCNPNIELIEIEETPITCLIEAWV